jgi:hypothetical protein
MPNRRRPGFSDEFIGLNVNESPYSVGPQYAITADNVIIESGRIESRPGRVELSEDQLTAMGTLGLHNYNPASGALRSLVIVRPDGIFQRKG